MHPLLIKQNILDEIKVQVFLVAGTRNLEKININENTIQSVLLDKGISNDDIAKYLADLVLTGYILYRSPTDDKKEKYITLKEKGLSAVISRSFKNEYEERIKNNYKFWIEISSQSILGITAIIAIFISTGILTCNKSESSKSPIEIININNKSGGIRQDSTRHDSL